MYQILGSDERSAKCEIKNQDWTRVSIETLKYLKRHVRPDRPARERLVEVLRMAARREEQSKELIATRCERGASIVHKMGFPDATAQAILNLDEHWNGKGSPRHARGEEIPLYSQVMNLAQTLEVYHALHGPAEALDVARRRSGRWFSPELVRIVVSWGEDSEIWREASSEQAGQTVEEMAPDQDSITVDEERLDAICEAFADVIDAKSPFTYRHSAGVAQAAVAMGLEMGFDRPALTTLRRAALLHDIGKLSVSNAILEKPGRLTAAEWEVVRKHPYYTEKILEKAPVFSDFAVMAASHHEKLDGSGYHRALKSSQLPLPARALAVADIYDALAADRPYRKGMPLERVLSIIKEDAPQQLDADCVEALKIAVSRAGWKAPEPGLECVTEMEPESCVYAPQFEDSEDVVAARVF